MNPFYTLDERLVDAVFLSDLDEVRSLLAEGACPDARDEEDRTPLLAAVMAGNAPLVLVLLAAGADPNVRDADGWTPLQVAAQRRLLDIAWLLVHHGADVNAEDDDGNNVLWRAVLGCAGRTEVVELLRRHGAREDVPNAAGITAAEVARRMGVVLAAAPAPRSH